MSNPVALHLERPLEIDERYSIDTATGCWVWRLSTSDSGYGRLWDGESVRRAHRIYYERRYGPVPSDMDLDHLCRNRACVNPEHLEPVTRAENLRRGSRRKLCERDAAVVKASALPNTVLGRVLGVTKATIADIKHGRSWRDVEPNYDPAAHAQMRERAKC